MDRRSFTIKERLTLWDEENINSCDPYNWREIAVSVSDRDVIKYNYFIALPYSKAIEFMLTKNKSIQRENKYLKDG